MSKFHFYCSCVNCKLELTIQNLDKHYPKCISPKLFKNICENCDSKTNNPRFCSRSCRQTVLNRERATNTTTKAKLTREESNYLKWSSGNLSPYSRQTMVEYLKKERGYSCEICKISKWCDKNISLQVDHIDGNALNNLPSNLRLLCPNCHSQTPTWGSRNKGQGRASRGMKTC